MIYTFILFPLVWIPIAIVVIPFILPEFHIPLLAAVILSLTISGTQVLISLYALPLILKSFSNVLFSPFRSTSWQEKLQIIVQNWLLWTVSTCVGYGVILGLLWLVKSLPLGLTIGESNNLFWAALILQWLPQAAQEDLGKSLATFPFTWRSLLAVFLSIISFPLIPLTIHWIGNISPYLGLTISPIIAAVTYAIYQSISEVWRSLLKPLRVTWMVLFPEFPKLESVIEKSSGLVQWLWIALLFIGTLFVGAIPLWLATKIVAGIQISYPIGLVTFLLAIVVGKTAQGAITSLANVGSTAD